MFASVLPMTIFALAALAIAAPPDKVVTRIAGVGGGTLDHLVLSSDQLAVGVGDGNVFVLEIDTWRVRTTTAPCNVTSVAPVYTDDLDTDQTHIYVGCSDGMVHRLLHTPGRLVAEADDSGPIVFDMGSESGAGAINALFWDGDPTNPFLYGVEAGTALSTVHVLDVTEQTVDGVNSFPRTILYQGYVDSASYFIDAGVGEAFVAHSGNNVTIIDFSTGNVSSTLAGLSIYGFDDIAISQTGIWAVDNDLDLLMQVEPTTGVPVATYTTTAAPKAVVANLDAADPWVMVAGDGVRVYQTNAAGGIVDPSSPYFQLDEDSFIQDAVTDGDYVYGGGSSGNVVIATANPWIEADAAADPSSGTTGTSVQVTFQVDEDCTYELRLNGDRTGVGQNAGTLLTSGTATAGVPVTAEVTIDDTWIEGVNTVFILARDGTLVGHRKIEITVDDVPTTPTLTNANIGFSEEALIVSFQGISDADLASYTLYISDTPFEAADYPTGGPTLADGPENPITLTSSAGASVSTTIGSLQNGVTYYIGVRAVDAGGLESSMSNVVSGTPEDTFTAAERAGEMGGGPCSTGGQGGLWALLGGMFALLGRRRTATLGLLALSSTALADEVKDKGDFTKQYGNFEFRYGTFLNLEDESIKQVFGSGGHNMLQVEAGPQITRFFEIDAQFGFYQELGTTVTAGGAASSRRTMLTWFPLGLSLTGRLQIFDEQIIVPHGRIGADYVFWTELTDKTAGGTGGKDKLTGSKMGYHYALGAGLLLDVFSPRRASLLEAQTGINDTYLVFEWRSQTVDSRKYLWGPADTTGFNFSGSMLTVGLKLDY